MQPSLAFIDVNAGKVFFIEKVASIPLIAFSNAFSDMYFVIFQFLFIKLQHSF